MLWAPSGWWCWRAMVVGIERAGGEGWDGERLGRVGWGGVRRGAQLVCLPTNRATLRQAPPVPSFCPPPLCPSRSLGHIWLFFHP